MIFGNFVSIGTELVHGFVDALPYSTRVGVGSECLVKEGVELPVKRMMEQPIAHTCLVYGAGLGVRDFEVLVAAVVVCSTCKVAVESHHVAHQMPFKLEHIRSPALPLHELLPGEEQVLD